MWRDLLRNYGGGASATAQTRGQPSLYLASDYRGDMSKMTVEIRTDENGYFSKTVPFDPSGPFALTVSLAVTLVSPFATGLWGELDIDAADGAPSNQKRAFVAWHGEEVQLGSWRLDGGENIIVVNGKTRPRRPHARLVMEIDATI